MITEAILIAVGFLLDGILLLFPNLPFPFQSQLDSASGFIGSKLGMVNSSFPLSEALAVVSWTVQYVLPALILFVIVRWVYAHIPAVGS